MSKEGFITISRKIMDWEWYQKPNMAHLFIHLILSANYMDGRFQNILIKRGQLVTSLDKISIKTGLTRAQIRTCFEHLKSTLEITIKSTNNFSIITICKYDTYQSKENKQSHTNQPTLTQTDSTPNSKRIALIEQEEQEKRKKEKSLSIGASAPHSQNGNAPPLPPLDKKNITKEECIALIQIPYRKRTDTQNAQVYNFTTTHPEFDSDKYKPAGRDL